MHNYSYYYVYHTICSKTKKVGNTDMDIQTRRVNISEQFFSSIKWRKTALLMLRLALLLIGVLVAFPHQPIVHAALGDWSTYLANNGRSGFNATESIINSKSAQHLKLHWTATGGAIFSQPVESN